MSEETVGIGEALEATATVTAAQVSAPSLAEDADAAIGAAVRKVEKCRAHLAGAEQALEEARAARNALGEVSNGLV